MFDALSYSESLADIGVPENQARLQAKALSEAFKSKGSALATKTDIAELKTQIVEMELRMIKWQVSGIGLVIAAIKFL